MSSVSSMLNYHYYFGIHLSHEQTMENILNKNIKGIFIKCELYHSRHNIILKPDLIIHRDIFKQIFNNVKHINLPRYIISDILFQTIQFNSDKSDIINNDNIFYHKCKLKLCNESLNIYNDYGSGS